MKMPTFDHENALWQAGYTLVGGGDEVGRGAFAGPVVTAVCVFPRPLDIPQGIVINDSKILTQKQRERSAKWIKSAATEWAIGSASAVEINRVGIVSATRRAFRLSLIHI